MGKRIQVKTDLRHGHLLYLLGCPAKRFSQQVNCLQQRCIQLRQGLFFCVSPLTSRMCSTRKSTSPSGNLFT